MLSNYEISILYKIKYAKIKSLEMCICIKIELLYYETKKLTTQKVFIVHTTMQWLIFSSEIFVTPLELAPAEFQD